MVRANQLAYEYIRERIIDGTFRPSQHLVEVQLAEEIGVSRNTIKKVLLQLSEEKLVAIEDNKGASVASLSIDEIQQYYEVRCSLEMIVVRSAASIISDEDLDLLKSLYAEMLILKDNDDIDAYSAHNRMFHDVIYRASDKKIAVDMIRGIKNQMIRFQFRTMVVPGRADNSIKEHKALLEAMINHDPDAAVSAIQAHLVNVSATIVKYKSLFI